MHEAQLTAEDEHYLSLLEAHRDHHFVIAPLLSSFRVLALLSYEDLNGDTIDNFVIGANTECANIGGAICAERAALAQLQLRPVRRIRSIYLVSDSPQCLTPGTLCREFLLSSPLIEHTTPVISRAKTCRPCVTTLKELYPFPSLYDKIPRSQVLPFAREFCARATTQEVQAQDDDEELSAFVKLQLSRMSRDEQIVYRQALRATDKDARNDLLPLRYAAGMRFSDGQVRVTWQHKTLEFGSSLDAVSKLIPFLEEKELQSDAKQSQKLDFMLQVDQFGILHAPFARARAYFFEFGFLDVPVLVHDAVGELHRVLIRTLVPESPECLATSTATIDVWFSARPET